MAAYTGNIKFIREGMLEHGVDKFFKKALTGEGVHLAKATGAGKLYVADGGKRISIINLQNEAIYVNGNDVLAFETGVQTDITFKTLIGRGGGESLQSVYTGEGFVVIQPCEEKDYAQPTGGAH
jgi:uncharacterized protein (AIM24 family)